MIPFGEVSLKKLKVSIVKNSPEPRIHSFQTWSQVLIVKKIRLKKINLSQS